MFCRFLGSFEPIFASFVGGYINIRILPPTKEAKIGSKEPKKRQNLNFERGLWWPSHPRDVLAGTGIYFDFLPFFDEDRHLDSGAALSGGGFQDAA
jgi:hypothetical protein